MITKFQAFRIALKEHGRFFTVKALVELMDQANSHHGKLVHDNMSIDDRKRHWPNNPSTGLWDAERAFRGYLQEEARCANAEAAQYANDRDFYYGY